MHGTAHESQQLFASFSCALTHQEQNILTTYFGQRGDMVQHCLETLSIDIAKARFRWSNTWLTPNNTLRQQPRRITGWSFICIRLGMCLEGWGSIGSKSWGFDLQLQLTVPTDSWIGVWIFSLKLRASQFPSNLMGDLVFCSAALRLWNALPDHMRTQQNFNVALKPPF